MYLLGYLAKDNCVYVCDKDMSVFSFLFPHQYVSFQILVLNGSLKDARDLSTGFNLDMKTKAALFLQEQVYFNQQLYQRDTWMKRILSHTIMNTSLNCVCFSIESKMHSYVPRRLMSLTSGER